MVDLEQFSRLIAAGESLQVEFKLAPSPVEGSANMPEHRTRPGRSRFLDSARNKSDAEIYEEVVALANTSGGTLLIGVQDDGNVTGTHARHGTTTDPIRLQAAIFNNTVPNVNTRISIVPYPSGNLIAIEVDAYPEPCATAQGRSVHRIVGPDGKPRTVPFYPHPQMNLGANRLAPQFIAGSRRIDLGVLDFSVQVMESTSFDSLDPLEFERLRQTIVRLHGDRALLELSNRQIAQAMRLVETKGDRLVPNIAGLLLLGYEGVLQEVLPTHQVFFQALDERGNVKVNNAFRWPLLRVIDELESRFAARNQESEVTVGLFRLPVPDYSGEGFREAVNNALLHRDCSRLDAVYIQWQPDHLLITSPGGFPEGITVNNILVHEPKPRNPRLAEAFKRIGLIEQTGRGADKIYMGQLRYGRPAPDYSRSDTSGVRVVLHGGKPSLEFARFVYEQDKNGTPLSFDELLILNSLFFERRVDSESAGQLIQKGTSEARNVLERLHERGLVEAKGEKRGRVYHLSAGLYRCFGISSGYVRVHGISAIKHENMVREYVEAHGKLTRADVIELCALSGDQAGRLLQRMIKKGLLERKGSPPRWTYYVLSTQ
jgi:ATP-dependent DNA helicase RecG